MSSMCKKKVIFHITCGVMYKVVVSCLLRAVYPVLLEAKGIENA